MSHDDLPGAGKNNALNIRLSSGFEDVVKSNDVIGKKIKYCSDIVGFGKGCVMMNQYGF